MEYSNKTVHVEEFNKTKSVNLNCPPVDQQKNCEEDVALAFVHTPARVIRLLSLKRHYLHTNWFRLYDINQRFY